MNSIKYKYLKKFLNKSLSVLKYNQVLGQIDELEEKSKLIKELELLFLYQLDSILTEKFVQELLLHTRKAVVNAELQELIEKELPDLRSDITFMAKLTSFLVLSANISGQSAIDKFSLDKNFDLKDKTFIQNRLFLLFPALNLTTSKQIANKIEKAKEGFLDISETIIYIKEEMQDTFASRAKSIIESEVSIVVGTVENEVYRRSGVVSLMWVTSGDEGVCPICAPLDGKVININGTFVGGEGMSGQYPPIHINCRCFTEPVERYSTRVWTGN